MPYRQVVISTVQTQSGPYAGLLITDEHGVQPGAFHYPILAGLDATDQEKGQAADAILAELNWQRTGTWTVAGTWDAEGVHMYAPVALTTPGGLTAAETELLLSYEDGPRIWDAASIAPLVYELHAKGMIEGCTWTDPDDPSQGLRYSGNTYLCRITDAGREVIAQADAWPAGKSFGELTERQKRAAAKKAAAQLTAELNQPAAVAAISALLDENDAAAVERHLGIS